ncbi:MAG: hypothetical protein ACOYI9_04135, partial [Candidatus Hydrogenedentales bacterium]
YADRGSQVDDFLKERFGWEDTGDYHMDNELFSLVYYYALKKFGYDWRIVDLSAKIRSGVLTREEAQAIFDTPAEFENEVLVKRCLEKQELSEEEFAAILKAPNKFFTDYPNYYFLLRRFRFFFKLLCRLHILPIHAYEKYFDAV